MNGPNPKKSLGQHWLNDAGSLMAMCEAAHVTEGDEILEIGPGKGSLTGYLIKQGANVFAVEFDQDAINYLSATFASQWDSRVHVEQGDIRTFNLNRMPEGYKIVANIPYYLTSNLVQIISEAQNPPSIAVLLVQKEVAERVCAGPGKMSLLSVSAQFYWETNLEMVVPAKLFTPPPKIDSQILVLSRREQQRFDVDPKSFFRIVKAGFAARRKTLLNSLGAGLRLNKEATMKLLNDAHIEPSKRPQDLSLDDWFALHQCAVADSIL